MLRHVVILLVRQRGGVEVLDKGRKLPLDLVARYSVRVEATLLDEPSAKFLQGSA
jgi:hypothetical protein